MSYVRFGWGPGNEFPGTPEAEAAGPSSLYMFGTTRDGVHGVECCGCLLRGHEFFPFFTDLASIREHLDAHRKAGHIVHDFVQPDIEADFEPGGRLA